MKKVTIAALQHNAPQAIPLIEQKTEWLRSIRLGQSLTGRVSTPKECHSFSTLLARWNVEEGAFQGIRVKGKYQAKQCLITITAVPYEDHAQNR